MRSERALAAALLLGILGCAPGEAPAEGDAPMVPDAGGFAGLPVEPVATASSAFWEAWGDGRAEISSYRLLTERYGEPREGETVLIYVTEPHDRRSWIKDDDAAAPDRIEVMKLVESRSFLAGIYPYSAATFVFSPVDDWGRERFDPVKLVGTVHEWCGAWHLRLWPGDGALRSLRLSYFPEEGEAMGERSVPSGTLYEDALLVQLRELDGPFAGGGDWEGHLVPALWSERTGGRAPAEAAPAAIRRERAVRGETPVTRFVLRQGSRTRTYLVERAPPRRVLAWTIEDAERGRLEEAELLETRRLAYWERNRVGDEALRGELGLDPAGSVP